jgi:hypothetical protein
MTDEQISRALAEKVMGWYYSDPRISGILPKWSEAEDGAYICDVKKWKPLTDDQFACAVLDKMPDLGFTAHVEHMGDGLWYAGFFRDYDQLDEGEYRDPDRRRAMAIAALKAVGAYTGEASTTAAIL